MERVLLRRRWLIGHALVVAVCILFVNLGLWQIRRLEERRLENTVIASRLAAAPVPIEELIAGVGDDVESLAYRAVEATGVFLPREEVLVRSQVYQGRAGWHVLTPLVLSDGRAVLVNRGWVPLEMDAVPVPVSPPPGEVTVSGWANLSQERRSGGAVEPEGRLGHIVRIDLDRLQRQMPFSLLPVYVIADGPAETLPIPVMRPDTGDEGPHLLYAIEWFSFTLIGVIGYFFLLRRALRRSGILAGDGLGQPFDDGDAPEGVQ